MKLTKIHQNINIKYLLIQFTVFLYTALSEGLIVSNITVPAMVIKDSSVQLNCEFTLESMEILFMVRWYKNKHEIFRFIPTKSNLPGGGGKGGKGKEKGGHHKGSKDHKEHEKHKEHKEGKDKNSKKKINRKKLFAGGDIKVFPAMGVDIDVYQSSMNTMFLKSVNTFTTGMYKCIVSVDSPSFAVKSLQSFMLVIVPPNSDPDIFGIPLNVSLGDEIKGNCSSLRSKPPANLTLHFNDEPASPSEMIKYPKTIEEDGFATTVLGINFNVTARHIRNGQIELKCTASIGANRFWRAITRKYIREVRTVGNQTVLLGGGGPQNNQGGVFPTCKNSGGPLKNSFILEISIIYTICILLQFN